jgi:2-alkenal reductase
MERIERTIKMGLATLLVAMLLALGGITAANGNAASAIATLFPAAQTTSQGAVASNAVAVGSITGQAIITDTAQQTAATQQAQQSGVLDARYAVQQVGSAVVTIVNTMQVTMRGRFGSQSQTAEALGSGVIISGDGYIVTNQHVVEGQQSLDVIFADGTRVSAILVGEDAYTDIAVIKVDANMPAVAQFGDSDKLEPGQPVVAIGTALGDFENTVTAGIVSGLHRQLEDGGTSLQDLIQTDAAINHGNSGGALLDLDGNVVGINTAVVRNDGTMGSVAEGLGFAIPSNTVKTVIEQLMKGS